MATLEAEAQAAAEQAEAEGGKHPGVPDDKAQRNFTDTESRIIPAPGGKDFLQAYNCQAVVDSAHQVIVAARATNQTSDKQQAAAMMEETIDNVGAVPREVSADAGYYSAKAVDELYALGVPTLLRASVLLLLCCQQTPAAESWSSLTDRRIWATRWSRHVSSGRKVSKWMLRR